ncbi:glycerol kinase [Azospirillum agricola]|uniref:glycerol kinase GlpK n=1 Tax=Azospirillum agricola TaxID=1720247 RepID=UPI001AE6C04C|nr:glycerol kinase GlpK [Azospirillum agricola]MBP2229510.1 glycerol kinase [Azospirillum agricola]
MSRTGHILAIDQGTTSSRAILFDGRGTPLAEARREFPQHYPGDGWVEHDPADILRDVRAVAREAVETSGIPVSAIAAIGITNQRETTVVWDRATGEPIHRAIVWQDRRTSALCQDLAAAGHAEPVRAKTGLLIDAYFSATKIAWILDHVPGARARAERGELCFGTIDSFLIFHLTGKAVHATDATNASRTLLFDIHAQEWDDELLALFRVPRAMLPRVLDSADDFGATEAELLGRPIPIAGVAGDQQAAAFGQACLAPGMAKSTYGTGCFALINTGTTPVVSKNRLLTTVAYRLDGVASYAQEGSIFVAGAAVKWLRDGLGIITHASQTDDLATRVPDSHGVYFVPAFVGLGAPHWDPNARAAIFGMTLDVGPAHIARAALEAVAYQTRDLMEAMAGDWGGTINALRVDGGMAANDWLCQFLSDLLAMPVERPEVIETTALGAASLAALRVGVFDGLESVSAAWRSQRRFEPRMEAARRDRLYAGWRDAVARVRTGG